MNISRGDIEFIKNILMPKFRINTLGIKYSSSRQKWPDIWVEKGVVPVVTVTQEWASHDTPLRRSQLVHEFLHLRGLEHGRIGKYNYNTRPELDSYSKAVYRRLCE